MVNVGDDTEVADVLHNERQPKTKDQLSAFSDQRKPERPEAEN
jgi:hypothetical protein